MLERRASASHRFRLRLAYAFVTFDIEPAAQSIVMRYADAPGRMGVIGTILGEAGINITTMQIGTRDDSDIAVVYLNVVGDVRDDVLDKLRVAIPDLKDLWLIQL